MSDSPHQNPPLMAPLRSFLLDAVLQFTCQAQRLPGVLRIALIGSLTTPKQDPKDADVLVTVEPTLDLTKLARLGRQLKGTGQTRSSGADIFLAHPEQQYIGRICGWRECRFGVRLACRAGHCGRREYLNDDLHVVNLGTQLIAHPPVELWPVVVCHQSVPVDVTQRLLVPLADLQKRPPSSG
ncbi:hypothetical protein LNV23_23735 [Paucibacter sp. DJ1R-11]|uniref:hypothetical protein n=1 Tax=Paucibacter sp. DJ1R-11 TaxID=2893556 RepID=UPI0021E47978|nr:hypothetical protein [Paucibacter sp. DJ1R-11]MCV2366448.1 hypothetical protein [Paucibacter sp. DJ1R-11]